MTASPDLETAPLQNLSVEAAETDPTAPLIDPDGEIDDVEMSLFDHWRN
jgi:hypothetical protein